MNALSTGLSRLLIWLRYPLLALGLISGGIAWWWVPHIEMENSVERMFPPGDPLLEPYQRLRRTFRSNELILAVYRDPDFYNPDTSGLARLAEARRRLSAVPGIKGAYSVDQVAEEALVDPNSESGQRYRETFEGFLIGADHETIGILCILQPAARADSSREATVARLREVMDTLPGGVILGEPVMVVDSLRYLRADGRRLVWTSSLLLGATILLTFRSLRWVLIPLAVVQLTMLLTEAVMYALDLRLTMVSSMLRAIITVVGVATVLHVVVRFREARDSGQSPKDALTHAGALLAAPIFWACATDAMGFGSLEFSTVGPVGEFGLMMAVGSLLVIVAAALLLPGMALAGRIDADPRYAWGERRLADWLGRLSSRMNRRPGWVLAATVLLGAVAVAGTTRMEVETDFTRNFRSGTPIVRAYEYVEAHFGGAGMWDLVVPAPSKLDAAYLQRIQRLQTRLRSEVNVSGASGETQPGLTKVISLADAIEAGSPPLVWELPGFLKNQFFRVALQVLRERLPGLVSALYNEDPEHPGQFYYRILLRSHERQPAAQKRAIIAEVARIAREEFPASDQAAEAVPTGFFVLLTHLVSSILRDQWTTFGVAIGGIFLMMLVALKNPLYGLIAMVPNVLPITLVMGMMGWLGLNVNMGAAMIAAVSMGLSIDSSIHYITNFRRGRNAGQSVEEALAGTSERVGLALTLATIALIVGFAALTASDFVPTVYFGALVSLTMLGGLAGNLVVLPVLLRLVTRRGG